MIQDLTPTGTNRERDGMRTNEAGMARNAKGQKRRVSAGRMFDRYERQMRLIGKRGQARLGEARVFLAGAGGLGCSAATYLAAAGIGSLTMADDGDVELSNLNRQFLYGEGDVGRVKVEVARRKLKKLNPSLDIKTVRVRLQRSNIDGLLAGCDLVVDALDNFDTRYVLNEACIRKGIPLVHGAVNGFYGQATTVIPGRTVCLKCVFPEAPPARAVPVIGPIAGLIGCIEATETIKYFLKMGNLLENKLLMVDGLNIEINEIRLERDPKCPVCGGSRRGL